MNSDYTNYNRLSSRKNKAKELWNELCQEFSEEQIKNMIDLWCEMTDVTDIADYIGYNDSESRYDVGEDFICNDDYVYKLSIIGKDNIEWISEEYVSD